MKDQPDQGSGGNVNTVGVASTSRSASSTRRRFIKGGASAAPMILTLTSRPVLGFEQACMAPSRMISGNHSGFEGPTTCGGFTRSYWAAEAQKSPKPDWAKLLFTDVFGTAYPYKSIGTGDTPKRLGPVLLDSFANRDGNTPYTVSGFASYIIAAHLNALNNVGNVGTVLKPAQVKSMWYDVIRTGNYCPQDTINMCWNATGVIGYLNNSGIVPS